MVKNMPMQETQVPSLGQDDLLYCRRKWQPDTLFLPGKSHGQRSLEGYIHGVAELDTTDNSITISTTTTTMLSLYYIVS